MPIPFSNNFEQRSPALSRTGRAQRAAEVEVFQYWLRTSTNLAKSQIDTNVTAQATWFALTQELHFLEDGLKLAGDSRVAQELLAQKLDLLVQINNCRLRNAFGR